MFQGLRGNQPGSAKSGKLTGLLVDGEGTASLKVTLTWKQLPAEGIVDTAQVEALGRQLTAESLGRMLFEITAAARAKGLDPEGALRLHAQKVVECVEGRAGA